MKQKVSSTNMNYKTFHSNVPKNKMRRDILYLFTAFIYISCTTTVQDDSTYDGQLTYLQAQYKHFNAQAPRFFLFGMGNREKYVYKDYKLININNDSIVFTAKNVLNDSIIPSDYCVQIETSEGQIEIKEDEEGIWINKGGELQFLSGQNCHISLPSFNQFKYGKVLRVLHHELLFNIRDSRIYPNILCYEEPFYRDAFMAILCLEKTGNTVLLLPWLSCIKDIYDMQNHEPEADNLGELLYMLSFIPKDSNQILKQNLKKEIELRTIYNDKHQYINGHTDGSNNAEYQTQILKFALQKNGYHDHFTSVPQEEVGDYYDLCWFTLGRSHSRSLGRWCKDLRFNYEDSPFPYLQWARSHYYSNSNAAFNNQRYPLSWEKRGGSAHFEGMGIISTQAVKERICYPHTWTAAEIFLKLYHEQ